MSRPKMTSQLASVINDGLYHYEQELWDDDTWEDEDFDFDLNVSEHLLNLILHPCVIVLLNY